MFTTVRQKIPIINLINLVHIITNYSFMVNFNIILSYTLKVRPHRPRSVWPDL